MTTLDVTYWIRLLAILAGEVACVIVVVLVAQYFAHSGVWRRSLWRVGVGCLLVVIGAESTGLGRGLAMWAKGEPKAIRAAKGESIAKVADYATTASTTVMVATTAPVPRYIPVPQKIMAAKTSWLPGWLWLAGFILVTGRMLVARVFMGLLRRRRVEIRGMDLNARVGKILQQMRVRCGVRLWVAPGLVCPVAFGVFRPTIVLPEKFEQYFTQEQQDVMLTHELAHLAARDPLWYALADLATALLWWHPVVWWARRQLHNNSELAADEATAILPDGPNSLAECLVRLGKELSGLRNWGWMGVGGNGFRSSLGKRVERLIKLEEAPQIKAEGWKVFSAKLVGGIFLTALVVMGAGWAQSEGQVKSANWGSTMHESWNNSPASVVLLAALEKKEVKTTDQVEEKAVTGPPVDNAEHKPERHWSAAELEERQQDKVDLVAFSNTSLNEALQTLARQRAITGCFDPGMVCDSPEVAKYLINFYAHHAKLCGTELLDWIVKGSSAPIEYTNYPNLVVFSAKKLGPAEMVNREYFIDRNVLATLEQMAADQAGASFNLVKPFQALTSQAGVDLQQAGRTCFYSERKKRLLVRTTLREQAVIKHLLEKGLPADLTQKVDLKKESKLDQAAVAPVKAAGVPAMPPTNETNLYSRTFRVDPHTFSEALDKMGGDLPDGRTNRTLQRNTTVGNYFKAAGVNFDVPPKMCFYNDRNGSLFVRATLKDLEAIGMAVEVLNMPPQQLTISAQVLELNEGKSNTVEEFLQGAFAVAEKGSAGDFARLKNAQISLPFGELTNVAKGVGIFAATKFHEMFPVFRQRTDMEMIQLPRMTTFSRRQAHVAVERTIIHTNNNPDLWPKGLPVGIEMDALAEVYADGFTLRLTALVSVTQLLDESGAKWKSSSLKPPVTKTRQFFASCNVWDGQTMVMSGSVPGEKPGQEKKIIIFVTPQMADPRGYPTHVNEDLEFAEKTIPQQSAGK